MTSAEWLVACLASRPPLTQAQIAALRPVFRPVMRAAPAATAEAAPARTAPQEPMEGHSQ